MNKLSTLILILILVTSMATTISLSYASVTPSVPEFTARYVDYSYDISPTYTTDPYTGKSVIQNGGQHYENRTIEIIIENQHFTPYTDSEGNSINLFYNVRYKGVYGQTWNELYGQERTVWYSFDNPIDNYGYMVQAYSSQNTIILISNPPTEGQMDIQVEALVGYTNRTTLQGHLFSSSVAYNFYGVKSGWSDTKTVTIGNIAPTSNPTQTPTTNQSTIAPTLPPNTQNPFTPQTGLLSGLDWKDIALIVLVVAVAIMAGVILAWRTKRTKLPS